MPRFWPFKRTHEVYYDDGEEEVDYDSLEYAFEFSERERRALERVYDCEQEGGLFLILKQVSNSTVNKTQRVIHQLNWFPTYDDVVRLCEEEYGGGLYTVLVTKPTRHQVKTYEVDGPPKFQARAGGQKAAKAGQALTAKQVVDQTMAQTLQTHLDGDPEFAAALMGKYLRKSLGIDFDDDESRFERESFERQLKNNPEAQKQLFNAELRKRGVEIEGDEDGMTKMEEILRRAQTIKELLGSAQNDDSWKGAMVEAAKGLLGAFAGGAPGAGQQPQLAAPQQPPPPQYPQYQPQPQVQRLPPNPQQQPTQASRPGFVPQTRQIVEQPAPMPEPAPAPAPEPELTTGPEIVMEAQAPGTPPPVVIETNGHVQAAEIPMDVEPESFRPPRRPDTPMPFQPATQPIPEPEPEPQPMEPAVKINTEGIDWGGLLLKTDWVALEASLDWSPEDFAQDLFLRWNDTGDEGADVLIDLFTDNDPQAIILGFVQGRTLMEQPWIRSSAAVMGKSEDIVILERIVERLTQTEEGRAWVAQVHLACQVLNQRVSEEDGDDDWEGDQNFFGDGGLEVEDVTWEDDALADATEVVNSNGVMVESYDYDGWPTGGGVAVADDDGRLV